MGRMQRGGASRHSFLLVVVLLWWLPTAVVRRVESFSLLSSPPYPYSLPTEDRLSRYCRRDDDRRSPCCARLTSKDGLPPVSYHYCNRRCPVESSPSSVLFALRSSSVAVDTTAGTNKNNDTSVLPPAAAPPPRPARSNDDDDDKTFKATIAAKKRQLEVRRNSITEASGGPTTAATPTTAYSSSSSLTDEALSSSLPSSTATKEDDAAAAAADDFRDNLQSLAELCCDPREPVIAHAARCEETWRRAFTGPGAMAGHRASCFHAVLKAWNHCTQTLAEHRFDRIVGTTTPGSGSSGGGTSTSIPVYTARDAAARATELLQEQCELYRRQQRKQQEEQHVQEQQQEQQHLSSYSGAGAGAGGAVPAAGAAVPPDVVSFTHCMEAWSKSRIEGAEERVQALMQQLQRDYGLRPDEYCYNAWLQALAASKQPDRLEQMHRIWKHMQKQEVKSPARPSIRTVNIVLHAYSRRIGELIRDTLNSNSNNKIRNSNRGEEHRRVREQAMHLAQRAEKILVQQHRAFEETGLAAEEPNIATYTTVMDAYARIGTLEATERCQRIMERLQERTTHAVETTSSDRYLVQRYRPTAQTYTAMINAWTNVANFHREAPERAQEVLDTLLERVESGELPAAGALHGRVFTAAMHAWGRSPHHASKAAKCWLLLQQMLEWSKRYPGAVQPNTVSYHAAMESCAKPCPSMTPHQQTASLKLAFAMFRDMQLQQQRQQQQQSQQHSSSSTAAAASSSSMIFPNHSTFNILLRAVYNCLPAGTKERDDIGRATFDKAIEAGQVDGNLVKMLQRTVTTPVFEELCRDCFPPSTTTTTTTTSSSSSRAQKQQDQSYQYKRQKPRVDYDRIPAAWSKHVRK